MISNSLLFSKEIVIFHSNDTHSRVENTKDAIGFAKISTIIKEQKAKNPNVLYLDAGDSFHGAIYANLNYGYSVLEILNKIGLDALAVGNHDFNYGTKQLITLSNKAKFPILSANFVDSNNKVVFKNAIIKNIDGIKIGIFGISTPETAYKTSPKNVQGYNFLPPLDVAKQQVEFLKSQNVDIIIALVHLGLDESTLPNQRSKALAISGVDLIIDGHSHSVLSNGMLVNNTLIVQSGALSNNLGRVDIAVDENTKQKTIKASLINVKDSVDIKEDEDIVKIIKTYQEKNAKITSKQITNINFDLEGSRDVVRSSQTNLGVLIATALKTHSNADVALINSGGIRASIGKGVVSLGDVISVLPFGNYGVVLELSGADIIEALEYGFADLPNPSGKLLQVAGISFDFNTSKKKNKISNIMINNDKLDVKKIYKVATLDFVAIGGDGYNMFVNKKILSNEKSMDEILSEYLINNDIAKINLSSSVKLIK